jgi:hypothetical protein
MIIFSKPSFNHSFPTQCASYYDAVGACLIAAIDVRETRLTPFQKQYYDGWLKKQQEEAEKEAAAAKK